MLKHITNLFMAVTIMLLSHSAVAQSISNSIGFQKVKTTLRVSDTTEYLTVSRYVDGMLSFNSGNHVRLILYDKGFVDTVDFQIRHIKRTGKYTYYVWMDKNARMKVDLWSYYTISFPVYDNPVYDKITVTFRK